MEKSSATVATLADDDMGAMPRDGRDEMNLAEFPIALLSHRSVGTRTLRFEKTIARNGKDLQQRWVVTGTDAYGLPLAGDEELYLVLLELTRQQGFAKRIFFSRYDLVQRLGWPIKGDSYDRIKEGLIRFKSVTITAENAFWDNESKDYSKMAAFSVIDAFEIFNEGKNRGPRDQSEFPLSWFEWGDRVLKSFNSGHIKQLDLVRYFRLPSPLSKRLFRFLDKKFGRKHQFQIDVFLLAHEHLAMTRTWKYLSDVKRRLTPALEELKSDGYLESFRYRPSVQDPRKEILELRKMNSTSPQLENTVTREDAADIQRDPVAHFYQRLFGQAEVAAITSKERKLVQEFIGKHGLPAWQRFVEYADGYRREKWPEMKTISGAMSACLRSFLAESATRQKSATEHELREQRGRWYDYLEGAKQNFQLDFPTEFASFERTLREQKVYQDALGWIKSPPVRSAAFEALATRRLREVTLDTFAQHFAESGITGFEAWRIASHLTPHVDRPGE